MRQIVLICLFLASLGAFGKASGKLPSNVDKTEHWTFKATYYHPTKKQCNNKPLITYSGDVISLKKLKAGKLKWIAISPDLLKLGFKMHEKVWIEELGDYYFIKDTMNARFTRKVDVLQHVSHKPMAYTKLTIRKVIT